MRLRSVATTAALRCAAAAPRASATVWRAAVPALASPQSQPARGFWSQLLRPPPARDPSEPLQPWDRSLVPEAERPVLAEPHPSGWGAVEPEQRCVECWIGAATVGGVLLAALYYTSMQSGDTDESGAPRPSMREALRSPPELRLLRNALLSQGDKVDQAWEDHMATVGAAAGADARAAGSASVSGSPAGAPGSGAVIRVKAVPLAEGDASGAVCVDIASFPRRILAGSIDVLLVQGMLALAFHLVMRIRPEAEPLLMRHVSYDSRLCAVLQMLYEVTLNYLCNGQTVGKAMLGLRVRRADDVAGMERLPFTTALLNSVARFAVAVVGVAEFIPLCIAEQRAQNVLLHNYLSKTLVLHERPVDFVVASKATKRSTKGAASTPQLQAPAWPANPLP